MVIILTIVIIMTILYIVNIGSLPKKGTTMQQPMPDDFACGEHTRKI